MPEPNPFQRQTFDAQAVLFTEGEAARAAYLIQEGSVEIRVGMHGKHPRVVAVRSKGDVIGEMALFDDQPHMASAIALTPVVALMLSRDEFRKRVEAMDPIMRGIVVLMVKRLRQTVQDLKATTGQVNWANWRRKKSQGAPRNGSPT